MEGFGVNTFKFVNEEGKCTFVKFHWKPKLGMQSVMWNEAVKINGADPDFHRRDLWESIAEKGSFPEWELRVQLFDEDFALRLIHEQGFDILDATKLIPEELIPPKPIGRLVLDRMVDNFFAETEQVAFCTQNVVPGIDFSDDPLLQGRNFSYLDTQLKRLGSVNFTQLPINAPKCPFANFNQDGHMNFYFRQGRVNYEPNSYSAPASGPRETARGGFVSQPQKMQEGLKSRARSETFADHYTQARLFYISQTEIEQKHIQDALTFELSRVENPRIRIRMVAHLLNIDQHLAMAVGQGLGLAEMPQPIQPAKPPRENVMPSAALSIIRNGPKSFMGRKIGVLVNEGADAGVLNALKHEAEKAQNVVAIVAESVDGVQLSDKKIIKADFNIDAGSSVLFDAVVLLFSSPAASASSSAAASSSAREGKARRKSALAGKGDSLMQKKGFRVRDFIMDAFSHNKFIAYTQAAQPIMNQAGIEKMDPGCVELRSPADVGKFLQECVKLRFWEREMPAAEKPAVAAGATAAEKPAVAAGAKLAKGEGASV